MPPPASAPAARCYAFFDLDHTLLPFDTQALFCNYVLRREPWRVWLHALFVPVALLRALGLADTETAKRAFLSYLRGMPLERLRRYARDFAEHCVTRWVYQDLQAEMLRHRHQGRVLVLNTASPEFYAKDIAHTLGFDYCVATQMELGEGRFPAMPRLPTGNNKFEAKITAMQESVPGVAEMTDQQRAMSWSYSDSSADLPLLEFVGNGILVHPSRRLAAIGEARGWTILHPVRPYRTKLGDMWCVVRQMFGVFGE